jgi:hypothetical protein
MIIEIGILIYFFFLKKVQNMTMMKNCFIMSLKLESDETVTYPKMDKRIIPE